MTTNPPVSLPQAQALAKGVRCGACGGEGKRSVEVELVIGSLQRELRCRICNGTGVEAFPQGVWPQLVFCLGMAGEPFRELAWWERKRSEWVYEAAPDTVTAILWVLGTAAARAAGLDGQGLYVQPEGYCYLRTNQGPYGMDSDTLSDLLDAVLKEVA